MVELTTLVSLGLRPSLHAAARQMPVLPVSLYDKVHHTEPAVLLAFVRGSAERLGSVMAAVGHGMGSLPGWRVRVLDGNHLPGSEKRLAPLRGFRGAALPGQSLVVYDPDNGLVVDLVAQEEEPPRTLPQCRGLPPRVRAHRGPLRVRWPCSGKAVSVDGRFVAGNASPVGRVDGNDVPATWREASDAQYHAVPSYLADLDTAAGLAGEEQQDGAPFVPKHTSLTDPQAAWSRIRNVDRFGYKAHSLMDDAHGIILDAEDTDARLSLEIVAARAMLGRQQAGRGIAPGLLAADKSCGTGAFLAWLAGHGIEPMAPVLDRTHQTNGMFARESFAYGAARDLIDPARVHLAKP